MRKFLLTRPSRDVTDQYNTGMYNGMISTHTPLAGRDELWKRFGRNVKISTHTPLAGRDLRGPQGPKGDTDFYSHAPRGT